MLSEISPSQKDKWFYPYEVPRIGKLTEIRMVLSRAGKSGMSG